MFSLLVGTGKQNDIKNNTNISEISSGDCPSESCGGTVTLCGSCVRFDVPGNFLFGYVGKYAGFSDAELFGGVSLAQFKETLNFDPPEDKASIQIGIDIFNNGDMCAAMKPMIDSLGDGSSDCSPCDATAQPSSK